MLDGFFLLLERERTCERRAGGTRTCVFRSAQQRSSPDVINYFFFFFSPARRRSIELLWRQQLDNTWFFSPQGDATDDLTTSSSSSNCFFFLISFRRIRPASAFLQVFIPVDRDGLPTWAIKKWPLRAHPDYWRLITEKVSHLTRRRRRRRRFSIPFSSYFPIPPPVQKVRKGRG